MIKYILALILLLVVVAAGGVIGLGAFPPKLTPQGVTHPLTLDQFKPI